MKAGCIGSNFRKQVVPTIFRLDGQPYVTLTSRFDDTAPFTRRFVNSNYRKSLNPFLPTHSFPHSQFDDPFVTSVLHPIPLVYSTGCKDQKFIERIEVSIC